MEGGVEQRTVFREAGKVELAVRQGRRDLGADAREQVRVVQDVGEQPEGDFGVVRVDAGRRQLGIVEPSRVTVTHTQRINCPEIAISCVSMPFSRCSRSTVRIQYAAPSRFPSGCS